MKIRQRAQKIENARGKLHPASARARSRRRTLGSRGKKKGLREWKKKNIFHLGETE